ncbi:MAG: hypothetical protein BWX93_01609 [Bacteroidetes bacterium ADurb.Bin139]|nr:MAG: hypothetical protein BWX93_01609 [Bacteroidetes bacterium ADurb.Bin139]
MQLPGYQTAYPLDAPDRFYIQLLRGKLDGGIAAVHAGKFHMFANGISYDFTIAGHGIHLHFLGMFNELAYHNRVLPAHVGCQL